jgi:hypothetical protein
MQGTGQPQAITLDAVEKRKIIAEMREDVKPLINQLCDYQIAKAMSTLK